MIPSPLCNNPTSEGKHPFHQDWSPPVSLLAAANADPSLIPDLIDAFSTDTGDRIRQIRDALAASDFSRIRDAAHTIKGGARQVAADALADACQELENASSLQETLAVAARLNRVQELFDEVRRAMASYLRLA